MQDSPRLQQAYEKAKNDLLAERVGGGWWSGELSTSALSTATAVSALAIVDRRAPTDAESGRFANEHREQQLSEMIVRGINWLADHQNEDGGWGDTDKSHSNIATTMLAVAAFHLTGVPADHVDLLERAEQYIQAQGGIAGLRRRYGKDKTFAVPILTNYALAGLASWREVSPLPFELACLPQEFYRFARMPVVSYAIPALVAIGQARYFHKKPLNPLTRVLRRFAVEPSLRVLQKMQPASGGYLEAVPLTSFVVMSLASSGRVDHPVVQQGVQFLVDSVRPDGSWPIDTNLATWTTTLAINALSAAGEEPPEPSCLNWLLSCQYTRRHPYTGADPGGWGWSDLSGSVPDADDTPGALLALAAWHRSPYCEQADRHRIEKSATAGLRWLLDLQNADGGWPTFCRGWGKLPFDRSGADLTAHALRALLAWRSYVNPADIRRAEVSRSIERGFEYLGRAQQADGSWIPLWFGNQDHPREENPVYGTAKTLLAYRDAGLLETSPAERGLRWLLDAQNRDGGWGGRPADKAQRRPAASSVEETALAVDALLSARGDAALEPAAQQGVQWLVAAVEENRHRDCSPIGFYFAKLWYYERLYPLIFTVSALGQAAHRLCPRPTLKPAASTRLPHVY